MNSEEATVRAHLKSRFESTFEDRVKRALEVRAQIIIPRHHFTWASTESVYLYRDGYFMATAMATQALNEGLIRFIADRNGISSNQDLYALVDIFATQNIVSAVCAEAMRDSEKLSERLPSSQLFNIKSASSSDRQAKHRRHRPNRERDI